VPPIGLQLARTARTVSKAFERALAEAGASAAAWQVLLLVRSGQWSGQSQLADAMGVTAATMTHHLNALERDGLVRRWRDPGNRRAQQVELTERGAQLFERLRGVAAEHDSRLREQLSERELAQLRRLLDKLESGVAGLPGG
jgi:MarR family transcriptional regulator for hemolysin